MHGKPAPARGQQEVSSPCGFEERPLLMAEAKGALQLGGLARPLGPEEENRRVRRDDRALFGA